MFHLFFNLNESIPNATDWIQAFSGLVAAFGLVWTLRLQARATEAQVAATKSQIELERRDYNRYVSEILPEPSFEMKYDKSTNQGIVNFKINKNPAFDFIIINFSADEVILSPNYFNDVPRSLNIGNKAGFKFSMDFGRALQHWGEAHLIPFAFQLRYKDKLGNKYEQNIGWFLNLSEVIHQVPVRVEEWTPIHD